MGSLRIKNGRTTIIFSVILLVYYNVSNVQSSSASVEYLTSGEVSLEPSSSIRRFSDTLGEIHSAKDFKTVISPTQTENSTFIIKRKRVVRRRKKIKSQIQQENDNIFISTTKQPTTFKVFKLQEPPVLEIPQHEDLNRITSLFNYSKRPNKKRHQNKINHNVWKMTALTDDILAHGEADSKPSLLGKRESSERIQNLTKSSDELSKDLHTDESSNNYINSSTPISNELQNSLQFTLQYLHPLLTSDTVLSENSPKTPENKTVDITHTLSDTVAQTPIAHDLGFLPTNLRKKHPLLNHDTIFSSDNGASKTGILTNIHSQIIPESRPKSKTKDVTSTTEKSSTQSKLSKTVTPSFTSTTQTQKPSTTLTASLTSKFIPSSTPPGSLSSLGRAFLTTKLEKSTTPVYLTTTTTTATTAKPTLPSSPKSPSTTILTPSTTTTTKVSGVLKILEVTPSSGETNFNHNNGQGDQKISYNNSEEKGVLQTSLKESHPSFLENTSKHITTTQIKPERTTPISSESGETSSAEQLLIEQLLGIGSGAPADSPLSIQQSQGDSNELLQLFSLVQSQSQNKRNPSLVPNQNHSESIPNFLQTLLQQPQQTQNISQTSSNHITASDLPNLLQALLQPQFNNNQANANGNPQLDLSALLNFASQEITSSSSTSSPKSTLPSPSSSSGEGLSDADLKSIFELLDSQTVSKPTTISTTTTPTTTTTTTSTTKTTPRPKTTVTTSSPLTTTLHPALQNMLDLFNNQIKPFQSIPSSIAPVIALPSETRQNRVPQPTTSAPTNSITGSTSVTTTQNSLDLLSQLLNFGSQTGMNKVNPVRSNPTSAPEFSLASLFGGAGRNTNNNNIFQSNFLNPQPQSPSSDTNTQSESNQLLNFFGGNYHTTTPPPPSGLYYWLDMNAFLGGDPNQKADPMSGIRPKIGNRFPFIKVN